MSFVPLIVDKDKEVDENPLPRTNHVYRSVRTDPGVESKTVDEEQSGTATTGCCNLSFMYLCAHGSIQTSTVDIFYEFIMCVIRCIYEFY